MKLAALFAAAFVVAGCSHKFSYIDAYKFDYNHNSLLKELEPAAVEHAIDSTREILLVASVSESEPIVTFKSKHRSTVVKPLLSASKKEAKVSSVKREPNPKKNWAAITAFVLGLLSIFFYIALVTAPLAIIFGIIGLRSERRTLAIIGLCLGVAFVIWFFWAFGTFAG